ncbi:MAG: Gfo/Idh/MocA family oxidoreductase [Planctomycetia bacterium]|nr:Gfo/Idh/MocA family oxidoreductase [Planctomycetia bacterium]
MINDQNENSSLCSRRSFLYGAGSVAAGTLLTGNLFSAEKNQPKIKVGQLGTGHVHAYKVDTLRKMKDLFEFAGIAEIDSKSRENAMKQEKYKDLPWMSTEELLALPGLQAVVVETSEKENLAAGLQCIRAGKHIHLDKPAGYSLPEYRLLLDEAKKRNLMVQMGYMLRSNLSIQFCIKAVKEGLLGKIYDIDAAMSRYDEKSGRKRVAGYPGGSFYLLGCHLIDLAIILKGIPDKIHPFMRKTRSDNCTDNGLAVFEYSDGCIATLRSSVAEVDGFQERHLIVRGERGTIVVRPMEVGGNLSAGKVKLALNEAVKGYKKGYQEIPMPKPKNRYEDQWREFAAVIRGEIVNPYSYEHDYAVQKCLLESIGLSAD